MQTELIKSVADVTRLLEKTQKGLPCSTIDNAAIVFREDPLFAGNLRWNLFRNRIELLGEMPWNRTGTYVTDNDEIHIRHYFETRYHMSSDKKINDAMLIVANENAYHPVREYLKGLSWDGTERIRFVLHHFLGSEVNDFVEESTRLFLLGAISRIFKPGCKFEYMLCLVGGQGAGKSSFIRFLACFDEWFCDDIKRLDEDKVYEHFDGHWILEIAEMLALNNAKCNEATKAFLSRQRDNYRLPYGKRAEDNPRQCVFAGTSNLVNFLPNDRSGNRRFLPIMCDAAKAEVHILENEAESRKYIEQVWAEAMVIYNAGNVKLKLSNEMEKFLADYQEPFMQEDTFEVVIRNYLDNYTGDKVCIMQLMEEALNIPWQKKGFEKAAVAEIMNRMPGWKHFSNPRHFGIKYGRQKGYERVTTVSDNQTPEKDFVQISIEDIPFGKA